MSNISGITKSTVSVTPGPDWATNLNTSLDAIDEHDHTSNKGARITPAAINVNAELEFNDNTVSEVKQVALQNQGSQPSDKARSIYSYGNELYYRDAAGNHVQITSSGSLPASGGTIGGMGGTDAAVNYVDGSKAFVFEHDDANNEMAKMHHSTLLLYNFHDDNGSTANYYVTLQYTGTSSANTLTVPNETGTLLTTATSYGGGNLSVTASAGQIDLSASSTLDLVTSAGNSNITLTPHGSGEVDISKVDIAGGEIDAVTIGTNSACTDLRVDNIKVDGNTVSSTDTNGNIALTPNGTGEVDISKVDIDAGAIDGVTIGTNSVATDLRVDNIQVDANDVKATNTNGDLNLSANGTGKVKINGDDSSNSFTLPDGRGSNTNVLQTDGSGATSWTSISALSTVDNIVATSAMNINGTISNQTVYFGDTFTVNGTLTVNDDVVFSNILAKTSAMTITNSSAQTITGDGGVTITGHHALFT